MTFLTFVYNSVTYCVVQYHVNAFCVLRNVATLAYFRCEWSTFQSICPQNILTQCAPSAAPVWGPGCEPATAASSIITTAATPTAIP